MMVELGDRKYWQSRAVQIWLLLISAEIAHGIFRALVLVPRVGQFSANQMGVFIGSAIVVFIAWLSIGWIGVNSRYRLLAVGMIWVLLTVAFELLFGRMWMGFTWERIASDYNLLQGGLMPFGLLAMLFSPMIARKLRSIQRPGGSARNSRSVN